jgi:hypothetical protein
MAVGRLPRPSFICAGAAGAVPCHTRASLLCRRGRGNRLGGNVRDEHPFINAGGHNIYIHAEIFGRGNKHVGVEGVRYKSRGCLIMNAKVMILGTFHFNQRNSMKSNESQAQALAVVEKLVKFKPNKIAVEQRARKQKLLDERFRAFTNTGFINVEIPWHINEIVMLGFQAALKCGISKVYAIDYMRLFFYDLPIKHAKRKYPVLAEEIIRKQKEFREHNAKNKDKTLTDTLIYLNSPEYISALHNSDYLSLNQVGALKSYMGTRILTSWYRRNLGIFANLQAVCNDNDRVLVIYGAGHLSILNSFVQEYDKMDFISPLEYL